MLWDPYSGQIFYNNKKTGNSMYRFNPILHMWFRISNVYGNAAIQTGVGLHVVGVGAVC